MVESYLLKSVKLQWSQDTDVPAKPVPDLHGYGDGLGYAE